MAFPPPPFKESHGPIPSSVIIKMKKHSWKKGFLIPIWKLHYLEVSHWGYDRKVHQGKLIVARDLAAAANNTSVFNGRPVIGRKGGFSRHSFGRAIDINPLTNPYISKKTVVPKSGKGYLDRTKYQKKRKHSAIDF